MKWNYKQFQLLKKKLHQTLDVRIISSSMEPWILTGSYVKVKIVRYEAIKPHDIVVYWRAEKLICHIVKRTYPSYFITSALNQPSKNKREDPPIHRENFLGVVIEPRFGFVRQFLLRFLI